MKEIDIIQAVYVTPSTNLAGLVAKLVTIAGRRCPSIEHSFGMQTALIAATARRNAILLIGAVQRPRYVGLLARTAQYPRQSGIVAGAVQHLSSGRPKPEGRSAYKVFHTITTRWGDNDMYGHLNNVVYYSLFDTAINALLIGHGALSPIATKKTDHKSPIGLVVETGCHYFSPLSFPGSVDAGIRVAHVGRSSVRYEIGIFAADADQSAAKGHFIHVYVDRESRRPTVLPTELQNVLQSWKAIPDPSSV